MTNIYKQKGIALFQVLLMTAIISVLALQFTQTAKNQVAIASIMSDRVKAELAQKSAESALIFTLLTETREKNIESESAIVSQWNFFNYHFTIQDELTPNATTTIAIQDLNSLISLYRGGDKKLVEGLLNRFADADTNASVVTNSLVDWQDFDSLISINGAEKESYGKPGMPTNMPLQSFDEILHIKGVTPKLAEQIKPYVTILPQSYFNPKNAPREVLSLLLPSEKVDNIIRLRDNDLLTLDEFRLQSGMAMDEAIYFFTSGLLRVTLKTMLNDVVLTKELDVFIQPNKKHPYIEYGIQH